jgi:NAD(P)-dependent dehydrogenase (short-subunit alcohol dehydrogenase family)
VKEVVARVEADLGSIDRVAHAAAIMPTSLLAEADPEWIKRLMRVNYDGTVNVTMACASLGVPDSEIKLLADCLRRWSILGGKGTLQA